MKLWRLVTTFAVSGSLLTTVLLTWVSAEDTYGVGGHHYIVDEAGPDPDLLGEDEEWLDEQIELEIFDPLEPLNRVFFTFNDRLYFWVLKPVKTGYSAVLPDDVRLSIGNFFYNLAAPVNFVNTLVQGRFRDSGVVLKRFLINTTLGVYGFGDLAAEHFDLQPTRGDLGETLGVYHIGEGLYICWPVFGPSNIRDSVGIVGDWYLHPYKWVDLNSGVEIGVRATEYINRLSITPPVYEEIVKISLDPYVATREAYVDYRRKLIESNKK